MSLQSCLRSVFWFCRTPKRQQDDTLRKSGRTSEDNNDEVNPFRGLSEVAAPEPVQNREEGRIERHDLLERHLSAASRR